MPKPTGKRKYSGSGYGEKDFQRELVQADKRQLQEERARKKDTAGKTQRMNELNKQYREINNYVGPELPGDRAARERGYYANLAQYGADYGDRAAYDSGYQRYKAAMQSIETAGAQTARTAAGTARMAQAGDMIQDVLRRGKRPFEMLGGKRAADFAAEDLALQGSRLDRDRRTYTQMARGAQMAGDPELLRSARQGLADSSGRYADAMAAYGEKSRGARDSYLRELEQTNKGAYYGETHGAQEIEGRLRDLRRKREQLDSMDVTWTDGMGGPAETKQDYVSARGQELDAEIAQWEAALRHRNAIDKADEMRQIAESITNAPNFRELSEVGRAMVEGRNQKARETMISPNYTPDDPDDNRQFAIAERKEREALLAAGYVSDLDSSYIPEDVKPVYYALFAQSPAKAKEWAEYWRGVGEDEYWRQIYEESGEDAGSRLGAFIQGTFANTVAGLDPFGEGGQYAAKLGSTMIGGGAAGLTEKGLFNTGTWAGEIDVPIFGKQTLGNAYQLGSSMLQSAANATLAKMTGGAAGLVGGAGIILLGSSAAAQDYQQKLEQGWDETSAKWHALAAGTAEALFEYISFDKLIKQPLLLGADASWRDILKQGIKNALVQGGVEASEEVNTTIFNRVTDRIISAASGYDNSIQQRAKELMSFGYETGTAEKMAQQEWLTELLNDALGGFLSGGLMTGGQYAMLPVYKAIGAVDDFNRFTRALSSTGETALTGTAELTRGKAGALAGQIGASLNAETVEAARRIMGETAQNNVDGGQIARATEQNDGGDVAVNDRRYSEQNDRENTDSSAAADASAQNDAAEQKQSRREQRRQAREQRKQSTRDGAVYEQAVQKVQQAIDQRGVGAVNEVYAETVEQYGEAAKGIAQEAITRAVSRQLSEAQSVADIDRMTQAENAAPEVRAAIQQAKDLRSYQLFAQNGDTEAAERAIQSRRNSGRSSGALKLEAEYSGEDGSVKRAEIVGVTANAESVKLSNGETVSVKKLTNLDADTRDVLDRIAYMEVGPAADILWKSYLAEAGSGVDGYRYVMDWATAYDQGRQGSVSLKEAQGRSSLSAETVKRAYDLGEQYGKDLDAKQKAELAEKMKITQKGATGRAGTVNTEQISGMRLSEDQSKQLEIVKRLAEAFGIDVEVFASGTKDVTVNGETRRQFVGENGRYQDGKIWLDINAGLNYTDDVGSGLVATMGHELTHFIQQYAPEEYRAYKRFVLATIRQQEGSQGLERLIREKIQRSKGQNLSRSAAEDEVVADAAQTVLTDSQALRQMAEQEPTLFRKVLDWIKDFFDSIREALSSSPRMSEEARLFQALEADVRKTFGELWDKGLREAVRVHDEVGDIEGNADQYSLRDVDPVEPSSDAWSRSATFAEVKAKHPTLFALDADESDTRNPTQVKVTVSTYRKIYNMLKAEGFNGTILDASSGLGLGTETGRKEFGFDVDDIEPFPDKSYKPMYTDYSTLDKTYDVIISNAVLNVIPQDLRDAMVVKIGEMLKPGGRAFINVRGDDVLNAGSKVAINEDGMEYFISNTGSYQKGFTRNELKAYLEDALGDGFTVKIRKDFGKVSAEVIRDGSKAQHSDRDTEYLELAKDPEKNAARLQEMVDEAAKRAGYTYEVWHGTNGGDFTVFDWGKTQRADAGWYGRGHYFATHKGEAGAYGERVIHSYLRIKKPFNFQNELLDVNGQRLPVGAQSLRFMQTMGALDPEYFGYRILEAYDNWTDQDKRIKWADIGKEIDAILNGMKIRKYADGHCEWAYDYGGWTEESTKNEYATSEAAEKAKEAAAYELLQKRFNARLPLDPAAYYLGGDMDASDRFSEILKKKGYDGVLQGTNGDEIVVFDSPQIKSADPVTYDDSGNVIPLSERFNRENEDIRYSERDNAKPRSAQAQRDAGYKLSESKFYSLYSAHKLNMTGKGNVQEQIASIMADGFKGDGGFGNNVMPTNISYDVDENGKRIPRGLSAQKYAPKKGEYILLVPKEGVEVKGGRYNFTERVKPGYKPAFDYEIVQADYDGQPYYEMYERAYDNHVHDITNRSGETVGVQDGNGHVQFSQRTWRESGKEKMQEYLDERVRKYEANRNDPEGMHPDDAKALMDAVQEQYDALDEIVRQQPGNYKTYEEWADAEVETDIFGNPVFSWLKANGDYGISGDASLICVKRRTLDAVFDYMIQNNMIQDGPEGLKLAQESIVAINDIIRAHGFETACSTCYIDARRYRAAIVAGSFCNVYNKLVRSMLKGKTGIPVNAFNFGGNKSVTPLPNSLDTLSDNEINWDGINKAIRDQEAKWESKGWEKFTEDGEEKWRRNGTVKNLPTSGTTEYRIALALKEKPSLRKLALRSDFLSGNGFLELNRTNKDILTLYNVKKGQAGPKATETDIQYLHEALENSFITPERMFKAGGFRLQSFSDYVPRLVFDYVEIIGDLSAKGVPAHMYTKEILCVLQHGLTGTKINMSLIPAMVKKGFAPGLDADGNYLWRDGQTFGSTAYSLSPKLEAHLSNILGYQVKGRLTGAQGFELAKLIQNDPAYGKNNGTIAIGVSEAQIRKMLDDADIRMVIPYHKSGLNHILASMMEIPGFENYESYQNTLKWNGTKWAKVDVDFDFNEAVQKHKGDARAAAQDYLDWCEENDYKPKFSGVASGSARNSYNKAYDFTQHADWQTGTMTGEAESNYYKVLADFTCYDAEGKVSRQEAVKLNYPGTDSAFGSMKQLIEMGLESDAMLQAKQDAEVPKIVADIVREIPKFEAAGRNMKAYAQLKENVEGRQMSERDYDLPSDLELMDRAADSLSEASGDEYWAALLETAPELADDKAELKSMAKAYREQSRKLDEAEKKLAEARQQLVTTDRKLRTRGISGVTTSILKDLHAGDVKNRNVQQTVTDILTKAYQKGLDAIDAGKSQSEVWDVVYNEGIVKAADYILENATYSEKTSRKWTTVILNKYMTGEEGRYAVLDAISARVVPDWWESRARQPLQQTAADRIVSRVEGRMQKQIDAQTQRAESAEASNRKLREDLDFYKEAQDNAAKQVTFLGKRLEEARADMKDVKQADAKERKQKTARIRSLENQLKAKREEAGAWKQMASRNEALLRAALRSKNADLEAQVQRADKAEAALAGQTVNAKAWERNADLYAKQLDKQLEQKAKIVKQLEAQVQREKDILSGKLKPLAMQRLLAAAREEAASKAKEKKEEVFQSYKERKHQSDLRRRIKNLSDEMKRRMTNPSERAYVPATLYESMTRLTDVLDELLSPKPGTRAAARYQATLEAIRGLAKEYRAVQDLDDPTYASEYDKEIQDAIDAIERTLERKDADWVAEMTGDTKKGLRELGTGELQHIYELLRSINYNMVSASQMLGFKAYGNLFDTMRAVAEQQRSLPRLIDENGIRRWNRSRLLDNMSVMRGVEMMSGWDRDAALYQLMHAIENGTDESWAWVMDYNKTQQPLKTGKNEKAYRDALTKKLDYNVTDEEGRKVLMTKLQALQILMTAEREAHNDKLLHLQTGGAKIRDAIDLQNGKGAQARSQTIRVTPELIQRIQESVTDWDRAYMKNVRDYFRKEGKRTNEILYKLKHRVLQTEDYYVPYKVDDDYLETKLTEQQAMNMWVKTPGSTNALKQKAKQPVIIDGMDTVMGRHVKEMGDYIGLAIPVRDFSKVYNGRLRTGEDNPLPVKKTIDDAFGKKGQHLLTQAVIDVQGGSGGQSWRSGISDFLNKLQGGFVRSALLINPSVTIKQAASYIAAESVLSHWALVQGNRATIASTDKTKSPALIAYLFANPEGKTAQRIYSEIDQHTSLHYQRRQGMSQAEIANEANRNGRVKRWMNGIGASMEQNRIGHAVRKAGENLNPVTWIQRMDVATTATLWVACKQQAKMDGMKAGTAEFWQRTTELYERVIRETQPMYDSLHRTAHQKQSGTLTQFLFPFRTVPIQNHGQLAASYEALKASRNKSKAEQKQAGKFFAKTVWAQTESAAIFALMTFIAAALKRKTKKYRDEDEELNAKSVGMGLGKDVASTLFSVLQPMYGSELVSIGSRAMDKFSGSSGYTYDAFSVGVVDMINDLISASDKLLEDAGKANRGESVSFADVSSHGLSLLLKGAKLAGIPADTVRTYWEGLVGNAKDAMDGRIPALNDESWERSADVNAERYLKAWIAGDLEKVDRVEAEMLGNYTEAGKSEEQTGKDMKTKLTDAAKDAYNSGKLDEQDAIDFLTETGYYDETDAWNKVREWQGKLEHAGEEGYKWNQYEDLREAFASGTGIEQAVKELRDHNYTDKQLADEISDNVKALLADGSIDEDKAIWYLTKYAGKDKDKAWKTVQGWIGAMEHPEDEDYSWGQYDAIDEALAGNKEVKGLISELTAHGVKEDSINQHIKGQLVQNYVDGKTNESQLKNQLSRYLGIVAKADVDKILKDANSKKLCGMAYSSLDEEYRAGKIGKAEIKQALTKQGGLSSGEAEQKIRWYDLQKANPKLEISEAVCNAWYDGTTNGSQKYGHESAKNAGMSIERYVEARKYLDTVKDSNGNGTGEDEVIRALAGMSGLTAREKDALYYERYKGGARKGIYKTW